MNEPERINSSETSGTRSASVSIPSIVRFAYNNLSSVGSKRHATCESCSKELYQFLYSSAREMGKFASNLDAQREVPLQCHISCEKIRGAERSSH